MSFRDQFKFCRDCPVDAMVLDTDGYWLCGHKDAFRYVEHSDEEIREIERTRLMESFDKLTDGEPLASIVQCPVGHWKRTREGGKIPREQTELFSDGDN